MGMESSAAEMGVTPRVVQYLFSSLEQGNFPKGQTSAPAVSITLLEIYNEDVRDLLAPTPTTPAAQPKVRAKTHPSRAHAQHSKTDGKVWSPGARARLTLAWCYSQLRTGTGAT